MKKILILLFCVGFVSSFFLPTIYGYEDTEKQFCEFSLEDDFIDDEIVVILKNQESLLCKDYDIHYFEEVSPIEVIDKSKGYNEKIKKQLTGSFVKNKINLENFNRILNVKLSIKSKLNVLNAISKLELREEVKLVKPIFASDLVLCGDSYPNDFYYENQWYIENTEIDYVWANYTTGSSDVTVGIIDTGISNVNCDLKDNLNEELSCSFDPEQSDPFVDSKGHGSAIAGIIGAKANNNDLIAGICSNIQLVSLKIPYVDSLNHTPYIVSAIEYAGANDIDILNISWQCRGADELLEAIENFPGLIVCSAGNKSKELKNNTANCPATYTKDVYNIISVGASDQDDYRYYVSEGNGSNFSSNGYVDIYAPGVDIFSTGTKEKGYFPDCKGTSYSAAIVTGVVALMYSYHPNVYYTDVKNAILLGTDYLKDSDLTAPNNKKLNARKAFENFHAPLYDCARYNNDYHKIYCTGCDVYYLEEHSWVFASLYVAPTVPIPSYQICEKCFLTRM